jgi:hypothetical protein
MAQPLGKPPGRPSDNPVFARYSQPSRRGSDCPAPPIFGHVPQPLMQFAVARNRHHTSETHRVMPISLVAACDLRAGSQRAQHTALLTRLTPAYFGSKSPSARMSSAPLGHDQLKPQFSYPSWRNRSSSGPSSAPPSASHLRSSLNRSSRHS